MRDGGPPLAEAQRDYAPSSSDSCHLRNRLRQDPGVRSAPAKLDSFSKADRLEGTGESHARGSLSIMSAWSAGTPGILTLPSGRLVRGRGLRRPLPDGTMPEFAVYLLNKRSEPVPWDARWVRWPDFWLPTDRRDAHDALHEAWRRAANERVEIACGGGRGRTGAALAYLAVLDGVPRREAVAYVRGHYDPRAVETPWQRRYVIRFSTA